MDQKANMRYVGNFNTGAINDGGERVVLVRATDDDVCFVLDQHIIGYLRFAFVFEFTKRSIALFLVLSFIYNVYICKCFYFFSLNVYPD
jgi:hypothetical protein